MLIRRLLPLLVEYPSFNAALHGDEIVQKRYYDIGVAVSTGKGLVVHRQGCKNLGESRKHGPNWLELKWSEQVDREFSTEIRIEVGNQRGALATVAATISDLGSNIENVSVEERDGTSSNLRFLISVRDHRQLNRIMNNLRMLPTVMGAARE